MSSKRSELMGRVRQKGTTPELQVRRFLYSRGIRYRLNVKSLPGSPDIVCTRFRIAIFVHGCFWHRHDGCRRTTTPKTRADFWRKKFDANIARDAKNVAELEALGWRILIIWECQAGDERKLEEAFRDFLPGS